MRVSLRFRRAIDAIGRGFRPITMSIADDFAAGSLS